MNESETRTAESPALLADLPCMTCDLPGIGGTLKQEPDDFVVDEIPAYPAEGSGEFLFLLVEKRGLSAEQLTSHLARELGIAHQDIGMAGMKDRHAVTRQTISVPVRCEPRVASFQHAQIRILEVNRHRHKLRTGHLKGNRFAIVVRNVGASALDQATAIATRLNQQGVPNFFGDQRFGREAETLQLGIGLLAGTTRPGTIPYARRKFLLRLALSAVQSALFNQALAARLRSGTVHRVQRGDVMQVVASGGPFVVEDETVEQPRLDAREIVVSGPLYGPRMKSAAGTVAEAEAALLAASGLSAAAFEKFANLTPGTRRPYLIWPADLQLSPHAHGLQLQFTLPPGSYATVVLREFQK